MADPEKLNPIIEQLSRIDKLACEQTAKAAGKKEVLLDEFEAGKAEFDAALKAQTNERLSALKTQLDKENAEKIAAVRREYEARLNKLDTEYEQNSLQWAENIFNTVIGG